MNRFRSLMKQSPAIVISLIALTFSLGSGAGYAASTVASRPAAAPKITWHRLPLRNGWHAAGSAFHAGNPAYTVSNSIVYLTGVVDRSQSLSIPSVIGILPKSARPKHALWFAAYNEAATGESTIGVFPNGDVEVFGGATAGNQDYLTSLAGIEFPLGS